MNSEWWKWTAASMAGRSSQNLLAVPTGQRQMGTQDRAVYACGPDRPGRTTSITFRLADELVRPVRLDLEDVEGGVQRVVGLRRPTENPAQDPVRNPDLLHIPD